MNNWKTIAIAFYTEYDFRTRKQDEMTLFGLCYAREKKKFEAFDEMCEEVLRTYWLPPRMEQVGWFNELEPNSKHTREHDLMRGDMSYAFYLMGDKFNELLGI